MRVIGVLDLANGRAVHASGGRRDRYLPVQTVAGTQIDAGDAIALARHYLGVLGISELYVADLDAIGGGLSQDAVIASLTALRTPVWVDACISSVERARRAVDLGAARAVAGLETLPSFAALAAICRTVGGGRVAFSLDLRAGTPVMRPDFGGSRDETPSALAARAADAGAGAVIVIDLARVGAGSGLDLDLLASVRAAVPGLTLVAGGGVRDAADLGRLAGVGCDGVLVASALLDGRLGAGELQMLGRF